MQFLAYFLRCMERICRFYKKKRYSRIVTVVYRKSYRRSFSRYKAKLIRWCLTSEWQFSRLAVFVCEKPLLDCL